MATVRGMRFETTANEEILSFSERQKRDGTGLEPVVVVTDAQGEELEYGCGDNIYLTGNEPTRAATFVARRWADLSPEQRKEARKFLVGCKDGKAFVESREQA